MRSGIRLNFIVEGQTEETFANTILKPHLANHRVWVSVRVVATRRSRTRSFKGGINTYLQARKDVHTWLKEDSGADARFTTMFDVYGLPEDFPGFCLATKATDPYDKVEILEDALGCDIPDRRLIPYFQLHEFEALLLSLPMKFDSQFDEITAIKSLSDMASEYESPELIDDGTATAPSKRIIREIPEFERLKASAGPLIAQSVGLHTIRNRCPHFGEWISKLEQLAL